MVEEGFKRWQETNITPEQRKKMEELVKEFATDPDSLDKAFANAWHKLTTRAFGAEKAPRCVAPSQSALRPGATTLTSSHPTLLRLQENHRGVYIASSRTKT